MFTGREGQRPHPPQEGPNEPHFRTDHDVLHRHAADRHGGRLCRSRRRQEQRQRPLGPGTDYAKLGALKAGEVVEVEECKGSWCFVDRQSGKDGWVAANYLKPVDIKDDPTTRTCRSTSASPLARAAHHFLRHRQSAARPARSAAEQRPACFYTGVHFSGLSACVAIGASSNFLILAGTTRSKASRSSAPAPSRSAAIPISAAAAWSIPAAGPPCPPPTPTMSRATRPITEAGARKRKGPVLPGPFACPGQASACDVREAARARPSSTRSWRGCRLPRRA